MKREDLEAALEREHADAYGWALRCAGGGGAREEAEDALHSAYERILDGRAQFGGRSSFRTWLFGVIYRTALEERRRSWRRMSRLRVWFNRRVVAPVTPDPTGVLVERQTAERLRHALRHLSRRQGEMLHLVFYQELSVEEAAGVLGIPVGTARTHYERGKRRLRSRLDREDFG